MVGLTTARRRGAAFGWASPWSIGTVVLALILLAPILSVFAAAAGDSEGLWAHLFETVLPRYVANTLILMAGVGALSLVFGVSTAWVVTRYDFFGRRILEWMLVLPFAVPGYIIAYVYTDFLEYAGPVQGALRDVFGWENRRDYWFPEIRSMSGAILVMSSVLYPYIYMMARTAFKLTPHSLFEIARIHDRNLFTRVGLPLARPAIVAGLALVLMETVSDFGTVEYFALETLTLGIFNVWLGMNSLPAAAQIASIAFLFVIAMLVLELYSRHRRRYVDTGRRTVSLQPIRTNRTGSLACFVVCMIPVTIGFLIPIGILLSFVAKGYASADYGDVAIVSLNSVWVALAVAALVMAGGAVMVLAVAYRTSPLLSVLVGAASSGYAFPGTILAIGVVTFIGYVDRGLDGFFAGGIGLVLFACVVRFQAIGYGVLTSGLSRLPPNMMAAGRVLGQSFSANLARVIVPLLGTSFLAGGLLVFVDVMKELPMTLLLRPFGFETLATHVYQFAKDELLEQAAVPALFIVLAGAGPVILMNATLRRIGAGRSGTR
jgi:iron(III) transport system permease protein